MPEGELVVADTSPLLNLVLIDRLNLIHEQFRTVEVPDQVWSELMAGNEGVESLQSARDDGEIAPSIEREEYRFAKRTRPTTGNGILDFG